MRAVDVIRKKRDGGSLTADEIAFFVRGAALGEWAEYQLSALLMAIFCRGMTPSETATLTAAMTNSGVRLDWSDLPGPTADKHSTGGVGDKTSLILAPLVAACGVFVPMMSGRGLGHTGGTLDKLEAIPGFRVGLSLAEFRQVLRQTGAGLIGQTSDVAPADRTLYALRDVTGTVESIPLITASILSKKLAEGTAALVLDVKYGSGAFMKSLTDARALAESLVRVGTANGLQMEALLTAMESPLGLTIGNGLEVIECIEVLQGGGPTDLRELSVILSARMLRLAGAAESDEVAESKIRQALSNGAGLSKFRDIVAAQGGDVRTIDQPNLLIAGAERSLITADRSGYLARLSAEPVGRAAMALGAGRNRVSDPVDPVVGLKLLVKPGEEIRHGQPLAEVYHRPGQDLSEALRLFQSAWEVAEQPPTSQPLIAETISPERIGVIRGV